MGLASALPEGRLMRAPRQALPAIPASRARAENSGFPPVSTLKMPFDELPKRATIQSFLAQNGFIISH